MQGASQIYLNDDARPLSCILDALACVVRTCCDSDALSKAKESGVELTHTHTITAVTEKFDELIPRNLVKKAFAMLSQHEVLSSARFSGLHPIVSAFSAFISADPKNDGKCSDSQVQSLLSVAVTIIEQSQLLYQCGPTYHAVSNCAVLHAHMINGLHVRGASSPGRLSTPSTLPARSSTYTTAASPRASASTSSPRSNAVSCRTT